MITGTQILLHLVGDYVLQSDWMANEKTKRWLPALAHAVAYTVPFLLLTRSWEALAVIGLTHALIDRYRLARFVCWAKNFLSPPQRCVDRGGDENDTHYGWPHLAWKNCSGTGYSKDRPPWLAVWLMIIADNVIHIAINGVAITL